MRSSCVSFVTWINNKTPLQNRNPSILWDAKISRVNQNYTKQTKLYGPVRSVCVCVCMCLCVCIPPVLTLFKLIVPQSLGKPLTLLIPLGQ